MDVNAYAYLTLLAIGTILFGLAVYGWWISLRPHLGYLYKENADQIRANFQEYLGHQLPEISRISASWKKRTLT